TRFGYQTIGHTVVVQVGHRVFGIDPLGKEPRILWNRNLSQLPNSDTTPPPWNSLNVSPRDGGGTIIYSDGSMQRAGDGGRLREGGGGGSGGAGAARYADCDRPGDGT